MSLLALPAGTAMAAPSKGEPPRENELSTYRKTAEELYNATSSDAHTFERAIVDAAVRREVERVFKRELSNEQLQEMALQARAEADYWSRYLKGLERPGEAERRIPGQPPPPEAVEPIENPAAMLPPQAVPPSVSVAIPDRWRILDALGRQENVFDPYNTNTLKADKPIFGEDWFFNFGAISDTLYEPSRVPTPVSAIAATRPGANNTFGRYGQSFFSQEEIVTLSLIQGNTAFKPPDLELRVTPAFNFNHTSVGELGVININPQKGTVRNDGFVGLQEAFVDYHLRNVSESGFSLSTSTSAASSFKTTSLGCACLATAMPTVGNTILLYSACCSRTPIAGLMTSVRRSGRTTSSSQICFARISLSRGSPRKSPLFVTATTNQMSFITTRMGSW